MPEPLGIRWTTVTGTIAATTESRAAEGDHRSPTRSPRTGAARAGRTACPRLGQCCCPFH